MKRPLIQNDSQFRAILRKAIEVTDEMVRQHPSFQLALMIQPQLTFIAQFLNGDRVPTPQERARVNIGVIAVRNFEDTDPEYADWLEALNYAFDHWEEVETSGKQARQG